MNDSDLMAWLDAEAWAWEDAEVREWADVEALAEALADPGEGPAEPSPLEGLLWEQAAGGEWVCCSGTPYVAAPRWELTEDGAWAEG